MNPQASAPSRAYTTTTISFGLASMQVELLTGSQESRVGRSQFVAVDDGSGCEYHPVGTRPYDKVTGADVDKGAIVKGVMAGDQVVPISDDEMSAMGTERGESPVIGFVRRSDLSEDQMRWLVASKLYQVRPAALRVGKEKRPNRTAEKLFSLMMGSLRRQDAWALIGLTMRDGGAKKYGLLDHHGRLSFLHYAQDLRQEVPMPEAEVTAEMEEMMDKMVEQGLLTSVPSLDNEVAEQMAALVERKLAGEEIIPVAAAAPTAEEQDVAALLRASLGM